MLSPVLLAILGIMIILAILAILATLAILVIKRMLAVLAIPPTPAILATLVREVILKESCLLLDIDQKGGSGKLIFSG